MTSLLFFLALLPLIAAQCTLTPTSCSCRYVDTSTGTCLRPHPTKPNVCTTSPCNPGWRCDCQNPTHTCSRRTCSSYTTTTSATAPSPVASPVLSSGEVACTRTSQVTCVSFTGAPIAPLPSVSTSPTPSITSSPSPSASPALRALGESCSISEDCPTHVACIGGVCRSNQFCDSVMSQHCAGLGHVCCDFSSTCPLIAVSGDEAICATHCGELCMLEGSINCVWRKGGDFAYFLLPDAPSGFGYNVEQCSILT